VSAPFVKPRALKPGDTIGLVAPASAFDRGEFDAGVAALRSRGFEVRYREDIFRRIRYLAGRESAAPTKSTRCSETRRSTQIFGVRGGYGTARLIHLLDAGLNRASAPKSSSE
jgi:muramoyltetrapeptide carboxypeptidase